MNEPIADISVKNSPSLNHMIYHKFSRNLVVLERYRSPMKGLICLNLSTLLVSALFRPPALFRPTIVATSILFNTMMMAPSSSAAEIDREYPGTAVTRLQNVHTRVKSLSSAQLNGDWASNVRLHLLWAGGLKDLRNARAGQGYTGHSFNDYNHCDLTTMMGEVASNENGGRVEGIHQSNQLGPGIQIASLEEIGPGGSWSTCMLGCNKNPPADVAHVQFKSRIAFKLVWCPPSFDTFVLVDDAGALLATGKPTGTLPALPERQMNYGLVAGSKYAIEADKVNGSGAKGAAATRGVAASELRVK